MARCSFISILLLLVIAIARNVNGFANYKWIPLKSGDPIPANKVPIGYSKYSFVGRARHYDDILPAIVTENGLASVSSCGKEIPKDQFEILTSVSGGCKWEQKSENKNNEVNMVRVGTAWDNEPIFISISIQYDYRIAAIYFNSGKVFDWTSDSPSDLEYQSNLRYLYCDTEPKWIEHSAYIEPPNNTVYAGRSWDNYDNYVARLKRGCEFITGQFIPVREITGAILYNGRLTEGRYFDLLIGEANEYTWVTAQKGEIPEYAVVQGEYDSQPVYVARINDIIKGLTHLQATKESYYKILVMNTL